MKGQAPGARYPTIETAHLSSTSGGKLVVPPRQHITVSCEFTLSAPSNEESGGVWMVPTEVSGDVVLVDQFGDAHRSGHVRWTRVVPAPE